MMSEQDRQRWDERWEAAEDRRAPNKLLYRVQDLLSGGWALDVACGLGQNAIWLAQRGYRVLAVDISGVALRRARESASELGVEDRIAFTQVELDLWQPPMERFDLVCVFRFLDRSLFPALRDAVKGSGVVVYETRHVGILDHVPDANPDYLLGEGELFERFQDWEVVLYEEGEGNAGIVARKP